MDKQTITFNEASIRLRNKIVLIKTKNHGYHYKTNQDCPKKETFIAGEGWVKGTIVEVDRIQELTAEAIIEFKNKWGEDATCYALNSEIHTNRSLYARDHKANLKLEIQCVEKLGETYFDLIKELLDLSNEQTHLLSAQGVLTGYKTIYSETEVVAYIETRHYKKGDSAWPISDTDSPILIKFFSNVLAGMRGLVVPSFMDFDVLSYDLQQRRLLSEMYNLGLIKSFDIHNNEYYSVPKDYKVTDRHDSMLEEFKRQTSVAQQMAVLFGNEFRLKFEAYQAKLKKIKKENFHKGKVASS